MFIFVLTKENLALAKSEVERLYNTHVSQSVDNLLLIDDEIFTKEGTQTSAEKLGDCLAFTKEVHELLFETTKKELEQRFDEYPWEKKIDPPFRIRGDGIDERSMASPVWRSLSKAKKDPSVDLKDPKSDIQVLKRGERLFVTLKRWSNNESFSSRRAHLRPRNHPTGLSPKLARCMVNLTGPRKNISSLLDPFCGAGGILIEGALCNLEMTGMDIVPEQIARAEENLEFFNCKATLTIGDATKCDALGRFDAIVTDLPFGKNSLLKNEEETFTNFFNSAVKVTEVLIISSEKKQRLERFAEDNWFLVAKFLMPINRTLEKQIFIFTRKKS